MCPGFLLLIAAVLTLAAPPPDISKSEAPGVTVTQNVSYGSAGGTDLQLDVYQPPVAEAGPHPAVVLIHGGGWTSFDKSTMHGMGDFLARHGFVAFAVDYRLFSDGRNRWPAQLDDVQRAVRWVRANGAKYGIHTDRMGAFGHSAGGQLAALLGMLDTRDNSDPALAKYSSRVQAVADASGPTDFTAERNPDGKAFLAHFLGASYDEDPARWREASPAFDVHKGDAPFLIVHGTADEMVPISQSEELYQKLEAAGVPVSFVKLNAGHIFQKPEARRLLAVDTLGFFESYLVDKQ